MAEHNFSVENTLTLLLDDKKYHSLRDILSTMNPADIAAVFDELPESSFTSTTRWISSRKCRQTSSRESSRRRTPRCASRSTKSCVTPRIPQARS